MLQFNPILATDSYKLSHFPLYPKNVEGMYSYIEPRVGRQYTIVPFGLKMWMHKFLDQQITLEHIDEAEAFAKAHGEPFNRQGWEYIVEQYAGYWPVTITAVPEGLPVPGGLPLVAIYCDDPQVFWTVSYLETALLRAIWYPTTIASIDRETKKDIAHFYRISGADMAMLPFALHDFGGRGVTSAEQAEIGGAAHLVNFMGSDTIEGVRAANYYYKEAMSGFSVPAAEHSIECAFGSGSAEEEAYLSHVLNTFAKPGAIVSIVIDGYDVYRAAKMLCTTFKDQIIKSGAKVVFRPDSGDMQVVVPKILALQAEAFGVTMTTKGYKKINNVGLLQGDGVDSMAIKSLLGKILAMGYSADNIVFGSGGALLQKVNRDTFKFAQKASAILVDGVWKGIAKDPITDPGKKSKMGRVVTVRSKVTGEYMVATLDEHLDVEFEHVMEPVYSNGLFLNSDLTLEQIRMRAQI
jgi:nicotinamide phosphoribosyltransferase